MSKEMMTEFSRAEVQEKLQRLEPQESHSAEISTKLATTVFDQPEACDAVARRLNMFETNLQDPNRPLGVLYFLGQSGVGKTEMARAVSNYMFEDPDSDRVKILNMGDYAEHHYASRLIGSPPSYVGYNEEPAIPHDWLHAGRSIVVFDEIEKAHKEVHRALLSAMDKGLMDSRNKSKGTEPLNFRNSLMIFTSNVASGEIGDILSGKGHGLGFGANDEKEKDVRVKEVAAKGLKETFPPEFLGRIDDIVIFGPIESDSTKNAILSKFLRERNDHLQYIMAGEAPFIDITTEARQFLVENAENNGGRGLKKILERQVFDKMADVMSHMDCARRPFVADIDDGETVWYTDDPAPPPVIVKDVTPQVEPGEIPEDMTEEELEEKTRPAPKQKKPNRATRRRRRRGKKPRRDVSSELPLTDEEIDEAWGNLTDLLDGQPFSMVPGHPSGKMIDIAVTIHEPGKEETEGGTVFNVPLGEAT